MNMHRFWSLILVLCAVSTSAAGEKKPATWKAGAAKVVITPEKLMWMSGYGSRDKPAEGKLHDLWAKALALEDPAGKRGVLVTMDLVGIDRGLSTAVCRALAKEFGLPREAIILSTSHTHTGPVVGGNLKSMYNLDATQEKHVAEYSAGLQAKLVRLVGEALGGMAPANLSWSTGRTTFAVNRRTNTEADVPKLRAAGRLKGPVDHDVPVLAVRDPAGKVQALLFGYACHSTVLSFYQWSGDYPGFAQIELEKAYPDAVALFWAGCGGDQNPLPRRTITHAARYGKQLADAVQAELDRPMARMAGNFAAAYTEIDLPFAELPNREQIAKDAASSNHYVAGRARLLLEQIRTKTSLSSVYPYPVQVWKLGNGPELIALGGEVVVDYSLRLKREVGPRRTWVMAYANDVMAYIPSLRVLQEGGYEGGGAMLYYGLPTAWGPQVEERIVHAVHALTKKVRK
jgi:neutral ceramidase